MRKYVFIFVMLFFLVVPGAKAQKRDAGAVEVLMRMLTVTGWTPSQLPTDAVVTGEFTRSREGAEYSIPVSFEIKGQRRIRVRNENGVTTTLNEADAAYEDHEGVHRMPSYSAYSMRPIPLPFLTEAPAAALGEYDVRLAGTSLRGGEQCDCILIKPTTAAENSPKNPRVTAGTIKVCVSQKTSVPVELEYLRITNSNPNSSMQFTIRYSDYRVTGGILVPFQFQEYVEGKYRQKFKITTLQFNVGLADSVFTVPSETEVQ